MENKEIFELLKIGLTEGEAKVYLALCELGSSTVGPIVKKSKVAYSNIYDIMNRLIEKGVISFIIKNKTRYFQAASPSNLIEYLDKKEKELSNQKKLLSEIIPGLEKLQEQKKEQEAEIFLGQKGLKTAYEKLYKNVSESEEELFFYIHKERYAEKSNLFYNSIVEISKSRRNRGICNKDYKKSWFAKKSKFLKMKFTNLPIPGNIDILQDKVLIVSWEPEIVGILIHSESIADNLREYFNEVWKIARE